MSEGSTQLIRLFVRPQYSISYRRTRRFQRTTEGLSNYQVILLLAGKLTYVIEDRARELNAQQALLLNPARSARITTQQSEFIQLSLSPALVLEYAASAHLISATSTVSFESPETKTDDRLLRMAADLAGEITQEEPGQEIVIGALVEQIVVHLLRRYSKMLRSSDLELSRVGLIDRRIRRAVEFMQARLDQDLSLKEIAAASYLSPFHFSRLFKKVTGVTPHAYHASLRITSAQSLLAETDLSITRIAALVGYASPSHFTKAFRQALGLTPRAFRSALLRLD